MKNWNRIHPLSGKEERFSILEHWQSVKASCIERDFMDSVKRNEQDPSISKCMTIALLQRFQKRID